MVGLRLILKENHVATVEDFFVARIPKNKALLGTAISQKNAVHSLGIKLLS